MQESQPILVLGGTGHYGRHIVRALAARGLPVRVLTRDASAAARLLGPGIDLVEGDLTASPAVRAALAGARAVVVAVSAFHPATIRRMVEIERDAVLGALRQAEALGITRVVYLSVYQVQEDVARAAGAAGADIKAAVERGLAASALDWTVLGACPSVDIFFAMIRGGTMVVPGGGPPALPTISPVDVGEIAAQAVLRSDLGGQRFSLAGPEALSFRQAAARIGAATGRPLRFRAIPRALPRLAWAVTGLLAPLSDRLYYAHELLGFARLLNTFPPEMAASAVEAHRLLRATFDYTPTTLEMEVHRRGLGPGAAPGRLGIV